jgi:hypothetical protein
MDPNTDVTYVLVINQVIHVGDDMPMTLLNPNQLRHHGIIVDDCPKHLAPHPSVATHSIFIPSHNLHIPLQLKGVISCIPMRYPSSMELETCQWIQLTAEEDWDPHASSFADEDERTEYHSESIPHNQDRNVFTLNSTADFPVIHHSPDDFLYPVSGRVLASTNTLLRSNESLHSKIASTFGIGLETAERTLRSTTQLALWNATHPIHRRFHTEVAQLHYLRLGGIHGKFHTDTYFAAVPMLSQATMGQMYTKDVHFSRFYPMQRKSQAPDYLISFIQDVSIPSDLHSNDAKELFQGRMKELLQKFWIKGSQSEPYSPWQVRAELCIREIKGAVWHAMSKTSAPKCLRDYCTKYQCKLRNLKAHLHFKLQGRTPYECVVGRTPDISEYLDYQWYKTVWYRDHDVNFPEDKRKLGKWLGVAHNVGQALCYYILPKTGRPVVRSTVQPLTQDENLNYL